MKPLAQKEVIRKFRVLGFDGPISGGRHPFMKKGKLKVHIPGSHRQDISISLQKEILKQAGIGESEWEKA